MDPGSPIGTLPRALSQPLEEIAKEQNRTEGETTPKQLAGEQLPVTVSPPSDGEASSGDEGPEDCIANRKGIRPAAKRPDPPPTAGTSRSNPSAQTEYKICPFCRKWPILGPFEFCSGNCEREAGNARRKAIFRTLKLMDPGDRTAQAIYHKFIQEWHDPSGSTATPEVQSIFNISLPYYEDRFLDAIARVQAHGGSNTRSAWFACQCICDVGVKSDDLCNSRSCGICMVIKNGFDLLAFGEAVNHGIYGDGIYANLNPAMAHRFTLLKSDHNKRVIILCSFIELEPQAPIENVLDYAPMIDGTGRVFSRRKDVIIPRRLIVYSIPSPPAATGASKTPMDVGDD